MSVLENEMIEINLNEIKRMINENNFPDVLLAEIREKTNEIYWLLSDYLSDPSILERL